MSNRPIPIAAAKRIADEYGWEQVLIYARQPSNGQEHVTTYGKTPALCAGMARVGDWFKKIAWKKES